MIPERRWGCDNDNKDLHIILYENFSTFFKVHFLTPKSFFSFPTAIHGAWKGVQKFKSFFIM